MPNLKPTEILLLLLVVVLLFGAKRLPDAARGLGRSLRIFKAETKGLITDDEAATTTTAQQVTPPAIPAAEPSAPAPDHGPSGRARDPCRALSRHVPRGPRRGDDPPAETTDGPSRPGRSHDAHRAPA